jgi:aminoglycoside 3-N-acetyltransferase
MQVGAPMKQMPAVIDGLLLAAERLARQIYWSSPRLRSWFKRRLSYAKPAPQVVARQQLQRYLREIGVEEGALVMAHTSVMGLRWEQPSAPQSNGDFRTDDFRADDFRADDFRMVAKQLVDDLLELVGPTGTLVMPTHARYQMEHDYDLLPDGNVPFVYDPKRTPCMVGLANELFWRRKGVQRSLHPFNTLAACGPLAEELFRDNLNEHKPLPHGIYSSYYRFCQHNGLVVSVGVPLGPCLTLGHVAEDLRDQQWPIKDFFVEKPYVIRVDGHDQRVVVRQWNAEYAVPCRCWRKVVRDLVRNGVVHEGMVGSVPVGWARAQDVLQHFMARNANSTYPYFWPRMAIRKRQN